MTARENEKPRPKLGIHKSRGGGGRGGNEKGKERGDGGGGGVTQRNYHTAQHYNNWNEFLQCEMDNKQNNKTKSTPLVLPLVCCCPDWTLKPPPFSFARTSG